MKIPEKYFHDRAILLLISINSFIAILNTVFILLRLDSTRSGSYIVQYRANLGLGAFSVGSNATFFSFIIFTVSMVVLNTILSMRIYGTHRRYAIIILALGLLLSILTLIVSNALLVLR